VTIHTACVRGLGVATPAGSSIRDMWQTLLTSDRTLAEQISYPNDLDIVGCRARDFDPPSRYPPHELRRLDRAHQMAIWAADDAHSDLEPIAPERTAVVVGVGYGAAAFAEQQHTTLESRGWRHVSPLTIPVVMPNSVAAHLSLRYKYTGPSITVAAACASGAVAIGEALWLLRTNRADRVLCGGVDALHTPAITAFFHRMDALSHHTNDPAGSSRPFSPDRSGFVLGEGAGFLILDRASPATEHSNYGYVLGYATNTDSHHLVAPDPTGGNAANCMLAALADARITSGQVGHVNAHGTSTQLNDHAEALAITATVGSMTPVLAPKATLGHLIGGAGAVEAIVSLLALQHGSLPPTPNYTPDTELPALSLSPTARHHAHEFALTNSFAFGGTNATVVLGRTPSN
jgi:3-oxoacyl-[acyl-carrier-protein] synthase II